MRGLNLFPYREHLLQRQVTQLQRDVAVCAVASLLLAIGLGAVVKHTDWLLLSGTGRLGHQPVLNDATEHSKGGEWAHDWLKSIESIEIERRQRLQVLRLLHTFTTQPVVGVFVGQLQWSTEGLEADLWAALPESVSNWVQQVLTLPGFESSYSQEVLPADAPNPLGLPTYRVRVRVMTDAARS